jgi:dihydroorotase
MLAVALRLLHSDEVSLLRLADAMSTKPAKLLGLDAGTLGPGAPADLILVDLDRPWIVREEDLHSRSKNTAFEGARLTGKVVQTMVGGSTVYRWN